MLISVQPPTLLVSWIRELGKTLDRPGQRQRLEVAPLPRDLQLTPQMELYSAFILGLDIISNIISTSYHMSMTWCRICIYIYFIYILYIHERVKCCTTLFIGSETRQAACLTNAGLIIPMQSLDEDDPADMNIHFPGCYFSLLAQSLSYRTQFLTWWTEAIWRNVFS